jgi:hypothetical protein
LVRDPTHEENDLCQLGLNSTDKAALTKLISSYKTTMATYIFSHSHSRKKRSTTVITTVTTANYTCAKLKQMGKGVIALNSTQLSSIKLSEFESCITSLGTIKKWSTSQLTAMATLALQVKKIQNNNDFNLFLLLFFQ